MVCLKEEARILDIINLVSRCSLAISVSDAEIFESQKADYDQFEFGL